MRKDIDNGKFKFPSPIPLTKCIKDILQSDVPNQYYLNEKKLKNIKESKFKQHARRIQQPNEVSKTLCSRDYKGPRVVKLLNIYKYEYVNRVYDTIGSAPSCLTATGGYTKTKIIVDNEEYRELTPREYLRLMGFDDARIDMIESQFSKTQLYKMAGNSIVVSVLEALFGQIIDAQIL